MLSAGDAFRSWRVGRAASAARGSGLSRRPLATPLARSSSMLRRCDTMRARIATVSTLLSSNTRASVMWSCSTSVWLIKN